jgi:hypothetical protein
MKIELEINLKEKGMLGFKVDIGEKKIEFEIATNNVANVCNGRGIHILDGNDHRIKLAPAEYNCVDLIIAYKGNEYYIDISSAYLRRIANGIVTKYQSSTEFDARQYHKENYEGDI